jgi:glycosyltransferase involved in cell wall biosynthesis
MESISGQDYPRGRYEVVIVDDGSTDDTAAIAKRYAHKIITHDKNMGLSQSRKHGISAAEGEIIVNTDADVILLPDTLNKVAGFLRRTGMLTV